MALSSEEDKLVDTLKKSGKSNSEIMRVIATRRKQGITEANEYQPDSKLSPLQKVGSVAIGVGKGLAESAIGTADLMQTAGQGVLAAIDPTKSFDEIRQQTGFKSLSDEGVRELLKAKNTEEKIGKGIAFTGELLVGGGAGLIKKGIVKGSEALGKGIESGVESIVSTVKPITESSSGVVQTGKELLERVPRFIGKIEEGIEEAGQRAERIRTASPKVQQAIKSGLEEDIIVSVEKADKPTVRAYKEMVDIAEGTKGGGLKVKQRPEIVAGRAAEEQYKLIEKKRKDVGSQIGEIVDALSKKEQVPMMPSVRILNGVLTKNGIIPSQTRKGIKLDFSKSRYTPQERTKIEQLYKLATEGGDTLTPRQIYDKDRLFSKLQRESRFEGVGDLFVNTPTGDMSLFRIFRDVYANQLDEISVKIKDLNREYRNISTLQDDIENSIIKTGKFETSKSVDGAEFAQTNLRRLTSDALSAADYRAIVKEMDKVSRELGYGGANPEDLAVFAEALRRVYPETIPRTSFASGIRTGIKDIAQKVMQLGEPTELDQQRALRELLESLLEQQK